MSWGEEQERKRRRENTITTQGQFQEAQLGPKQTVLCLLLFLLPSETDLEKDIFNVNETCSKVQLLYLMTGMFFLLEEDFIS